MNDTTHITRDGQRIRIEDMEDSHLLNTIRLWEKRAAEGVQVKRILHFQVDEQSDSYKQKTYVSTIFGDDALKILNYQDYVNEASKRKLIKEMHG